MSLVSLFGTEWRSLLFFEKHASIELQDFCDEILLISLSHPNSPQVELFELLRQKAKRSRLAHRLFVTWRLVSDYHSFPAPDVAAAIIVCVDMILQNRYSCDNWSCFRFCPLSLLSLLHMRMGCSLSDVCCSVFCYVGCDYPDLVPDGPTHFLLTVFLPSVRHLRVVTVAPKVHIGDIPLFTFHPTETSVMFVSVRDSVQGARLHPMQLTSLRASLSHRVYRYLSVRWICPLTGTNQAIPRFPKAETPDFTMAAFRSSDAASEWSSLAKELLQLYSARCCNVAQKGSDLMEKMAKLLPFACCKAVQRLLRFPLLNVNLCTRGYFVYCLVSPFLRKVYVGAVGFKNARAPFTRFREHLNTAKMWASRTSAQRYGKRAPSLYTAIAKSGVENVIQVILAQTTRERLAATECAFIRLLSPVFNVQGVSGDIALPQAIQRLFVSSVCEDIRLVGAKILRHNCPHLPAQAWPVLIAGIRRTGDRELAAKVARQARQVCPKLARLRSSPRLMFPCPISKQLLSQLNGQIRAALRALPYVCRSLQFDLVVEAGSIGWQKTPNAEMLLSPSKLPFDKIGPCRCASYASDIPRLHGHVITRTWGVLPCCSELARLAVNSSFQCRTYPPLERICEVFGNRLFRFLKTAGFADDHLDSRSALFLIQHVAC